jgi:flagellar FliL protein
MAALDTLDPDEAIAIADSATTSPRPNRKKLLIIGALSLLGLGALGIGYHFFFGTNSQAAVTSGVVELPEMVSNLNAGPRRTSFVRLRAQLILANSADKAAVIAAEPRIEDLFQTYLRDMRPEELRGSAGSYRLREELIARANIAVAPAKVSEILFIELLVQ